MLHFILVCVSQAVSGVSTPIMTGSRHTVRLCQGSPLPSPWSCLSDIQWTSTNHHRVISESFTVDMSVCRYSVLNRQYWETLLWTVNIEVAQQRIVTICFFSENSQNSPKNIYPNANSTLTMEVWTHQKWGINIFYHPKQNMCTYHIRSCVHILHF